MRIWFACLLSVCLWPVASDAQSVGAAVSNTIPHHPLPIPPVGSSVAGSHCYGPHPAPGYGYGLYGGYGYNPGFGVTFTNGIPFGYNYSGYYGFGGPGFGIGYSAPLFGPTYYGPNWGGYSGWSTTITPVPVAPPLPALPKWMIDEANLDPNQAPKPRPIAQTHRSLIQPSTPEAQLRSVRMQAAGDRLFVKLDYSAAEKSYAKAIQAAPDRPDPYVRLAMTKAARGDLRAAVAYLKQMTEVDPTYPGRSDSLDALYGHQNGIAKLQLKQRVADWTKEDIHDTDRIYLLAAMLYFDRDNRFRTLLETAVKLDGELPCYRAFLEAALPAEQAVAAPTPDEIDALTLPAQPAAPALLKVPKASTPPPAPLLLPPTLPKVPSP